MFHWKIIIILIIIQIIFYTNFNKQTENTKNCISLSIMNFTILWIKFNITLIDYSKSIIKKNTDIVTLHNKTLNLRNELIETFNKIFDNITIFENLINNQIIIKTNLCICININKQDEVKKYSEKLTENNNKLIKLFLMIKNNKINNEELVNTMNNHNKLYIKSMTHIKKIDGDELQRELVIGSIDTVKMLFI